MTGNAESGRLLERFERENLFLLPIDTSDAEPWYRFHRLFATFLHRRLARLGATEIAGIHTRASHWFAGRDLLIEAMRHAMLADDTAFAVTLVDRTARRFVNGANFVELLKWCDALPPESLAGQLNVLLCMAWAQLSCGRIDEFERTMSTIAAHPGRETASAEAESRLLRAYFLISTDDGAAALEILEQTQQDASGLNPFQTLIASNITSICLVYAGQFERAREVARLRRQIDIRGRPDRPRPLIDVVDGFSHLIEGNIAIAKTALTAFIKDIEPHTEFAFDAVGLFSGYLLEALYQENEIQEARDLLDQHIDAIDAVGNHNGLLHAYRVRARIELLGGEVVAAEKTLSLIEEFGYRRKLDRLIAWSLHERIEIALHVKQHAAVPDLLARLQEIGKRYADCVDCARAEIGLVALLARANAACALESDVSARAAIEAALVAAQRNRRQLSVTRLVLMRALVLHRSGRVDAALDEARQALDDAAVKCMRRVLPDIGVSVLPMVDRLLDGERDVGRRTLLESAQAELGRHDGNERRPPASAVLLPTATTEILSARESEILVLLSRALSAKTIARSLDLSVGTVKWHMRNVYGKLGANSREEALSKARSLHILQ
ncbi:helix-turn-helix transcriptional regulator [Solimonas terrae]|uniref:helix-turn-helix transcriptional regulator n=1 Tax=Solimonas terrae TaxID=1396819 RepID=UPI00344D6ACA